MTVVPSCLLLPTAFPVLCIVASATLIFYRPQVAQEGGGSGPHCHLTSSDLHEDEAIATGITVTGEKTEEMDLDQTGS